MKKEKKLSDFILEDHFELNAYMNYLMTQFSAEISEKQKRCQTSIVS